MSWTDESAGNAARTGSGLGLPMGLPTARGFHSYYGRSKGAFAVTVAAGSQPAQASDCQPEATKRSSFEGGPRAASAQASGQAQVDEQPGRRRVPLAASDPEKEHLSAATFLL